jgi:hypothetical protein
MSIQTTNWRKRLPSIDAVMFMMAGVGMMMFAIDIGTGDRAEKNCAYAQTRLSALRECATLPNCRVESEDFTYAVSLEKKWCKK